MQTDFPSFASDPRRETKLYCLAMAVSVIIILCALIYEVIGYYLISERLDSMTLKIDKYSSLIVDVSDSGSKESEYFAFKQKLESFEGVIESALPVESVLDYFEEHLDTDSALERVLYDTRKLQALIYVKSANPPAFEQAISGQPSDRSRVGILSKQQYEKNGYKMIYELRMAL